MADMKDERNVKHNEDVKDERYADYDADLKDAYTKVDLAKEEGIKDEDKAAYDRVRANEKLKDVEYVGYENWRGVPYTKKEWEDGRSRREALTDDDYRAGRFPDNRFLTKEEWEYEHEVLRQNVERAKAALFYHRNPVYNTMNVDGEIVDERGVVVERDGRWEDRGPEYRDMTKDQWEAKSDVKRDVKSDGVVLNKTRWEDRGPEYKDMTKEQWDAKFSKPTWKK
jgi:hypothetical protein